MAATFIKVALFLVVSLYLLPCYQSEPELGNKEVFMYVEENEENADVEAPQSFEGNEDHPETANDAGGEMLEQMEVLGPEEGDDGESTVTDEDWDEDEQEITDDTDSDVTTVTYIGKETVKIPAAIAGQGVDKVTPVPGLELSVLPVGNISSLNLSDPGIANLTEKVTRKITCVGRNKTENGTIEEIKVQMVNSSELLHRLGSKNDSSGNCAIVMFYAPWCMFSAKTSPHYNALARAFPQMEVMAIDAILYSNLNARFGTIAVPNILVFHNSKAVARFNSSTRTLETMRDFVANITGLQPNTSVEVTPLDYEGPLSSTPTQELDYLLCLSWLFVISFTIYMFTNSHTGHKVWNFITSFGHEHHHQHID